MHADVVAHASLECINCGYPLRGLSEEGVCPECGTPISRSQQGELLRYANQEWLTDVARGMGFVHFSILALLLGILGLFIFVLLLATLRTWIPNWVGNVVFDQVLSVVVLVVFAVAPLVMMVGLWWMTTPEPRVQERGSVRTMVLRGLSLAVIPALAVLLPAQRFIFPLPAWLNAALAVIAFIIIVAHYVMMVDLLQSFDRRCAPPDDKRRELLSKYRSQGLGCAIVAAILSIGFVLSARTFGPAQPTIHGVAVLIWLAVISFTRGTMRRIEFERQMAASESAKHV